MYVPKWTPESFQYYKLAAYHGARLLDQVKPNWIYETDIKRLDLKDPAVCILGQNYSWYATGLKELGLKDEEAAALGFVVNVDSRLDYDSSNVNRAYSMLTEAWVGEINKRLS